MHLLHLVREIRYYYLLEYYLTLLLVREMRETAAYYLLLTTYYLLLATYYYLTLHLRVEMSEIKARRLQPTVCSPGLPCAQGAG